MRTEIATLGRFILVGILNTAIGYCFILAALWAGAGDYPANMIGFSLGLPISYALHRLWTFRPRHRPNVAEVLRYLAAFAISYGFNLGVVAAGREAGYVENPLVQGLAICTYAAVFYVISRRLVFRSHGLPRARKG